MLNAGDKLGPYEITGAIGAGGMGEVYRARDTRLDRTVAIKVLLSDISNDPTRRQRFEREARAVAALNHPNICVLHDIGREGDTDYLVLEFLEGETLATRLERGPLPATELLRVGGEIADALDKAHRQGLTHRDLKPGNIMLTKSGAKLLDFGLAKAMKGPPAADTLTAMATAGADKPLTAQGTIVGTFHYMAPEQVEGREADARSDIFALGAVLYEMATGRKAFEGKTTASVIAAVLERDPEPITHSQPMTPPALERVVKTCLAKDPDDRFQNAHDVKLQLEWIRDAGSQAGVAAPVAAKRRKREWMAWAAAGVFALVAVTLAVALFALLRAPAVPAPSVTRFDVDMGKLNLARGVAGGKLAISPDGRKMVFLARQSGSQTRQLYLRSMDREGVTPLAGTEGAMQPFFSADSQWVGFSADKKLMKVPLSGGLPVTLCDAPGRYGVAGTWADNGSIYFTTQAGKVDRVPAGGGTPQPVAGGDPAKLPYVWISSLPGSRGLLLVAAQSRSEFDIDVLSLETGKSKRLIENGSWPRYLPSGQILYSQYSSAGDSPGFTGGLLAVPFDLKSLTVTGSPVPVAEGVRIGSGGAGAYDVAAEGTLVYYPGSDATANTRLAWLDSKGKIETLPAPQGNYSFPSISPDGKLVALTSVTGSSSDIYIYDLIRSTMQRLTFNGQAFWAVFTRDGSRVVYASAGAKGGVPNLWIRAADGSGNAERLTTSKRTQYVGSVSPDGKLLAYYQGNPNTGADIYVMPIVGNGKPKVFLQTPSNEIFPVFSPDGKWIAYHSNESGKVQVYVQAFPGPGGKHQISVRGGAGAVWSRDGKKLYYRAGDNLMEVDVTTRPTFRAGTPRLVAANLSLAQNAHYFDVAPDGRILLLQSVRQSQQGNPPLHVVLHFASEVQSRFLLAKQ